MRRLIELYSGQVTFLMPTAAYAEAEEHLSLLVIRRKGNPEEQQAVLQALGELVEMVGVEIYCEFEDLARDRLKSRDQEDWPILACALAFDCPIWTEDTDFFGCGVPTWTSDRVEAFLRA